MPFKQISKACRIATASQYRPQVLARGRTLDWHALTKDVDQEIATVRNATFQKK